MDKLGRRGFIAAAAASVALFAKPTAAREIIFASGTGNSSGSGPSGALLGRAKAALDANISRVRNRDLLAIADFSRPSRDPRFHLVNLTSGHSSTFLVAHGKGSDPEHSGWVRSFSNVQGSEATSAGSYLVGETYFGQYGESRRLIGLEPQNDQAEARAIVIHPAWYVNETLIAEQGKIGRSQGCFAFSKSDIGEILNRLAPGSLLYAGK